MNWRRYPLLLLVPVILAGCATVPQSPSVMVLPGPGKSFAAFQTDDYACRQWAQQQAGVAPTAAANQNLASSAAIGTILGAGLGAAVGAASGDPGIGAGIGAASGLVGGTALGANSAYAAGADAQRRYDIAYQQCMYAKGNQIPGVGVQASSPPPPPPPPGYNSGATYPPPGAYPPPAYPPPPQ